MKNLLQEISEATKREVKLLANGIDRYHNSTLQSTKLSGIRIKEIGSSHLYHYPTRGIPTLVIPSLINGPQILDLSPAKSFMQDLRKGGINAFLLDWGNPGSAESKYDLQDYINNILIPAVDFIYKKHGPVTLVGYCMGGFIATALACVSGRKINKLVSIASPWDFSYWSKLPRPLINSTDDSTNIPASIIQQLFYFANPFDVNRKYVKFCEGAFNEQEFIEIENWVNAGIDMSPRVFKECFEGMLGDNILAENKWIINEQVINPGNLDIPIMSVIFKKDSIIPLPSALSFAEECTSVNLIQVDSGHISAIIKNKYKLAKTISNWIRN